MITLKPARSASEFCCIIELIFETQNTNIPRQYFADDEDQNSYSAVLRSRGTAYQVLLNNNLVGVCWVELHKKQLFIHGLVIKEYFRDRGIGTQVIHALQSIYQTRCDTIGLKVHQSNTGAIRFYDRLGFNFQDFDDAHCFWTMHKQIVAEPQMLEVA